MRRLRGYLALTPAGRAVVLRSLLLLPVVAVLLRTRGMRRTAAVLERMQVRAATKADTLAPRQLAWLVDAAAATLGANCLQRSLVLRQLLRNRGVTADMRLGVSRPVNGRLCAHAWVELDGLPLNDRPDVFEHYAPLTGVKTGFDVGRS